MKECKIIKKLIHKKLEGIILPHEEELLNTHLDKCLKCRDEFIIYSKIKENLKNYKYKEVPDWFSTKLHYKLINLKDTQQQEVVRRLLVGSFYKYAFVFSIFLFIILGVFVYTIRSPRIVVYSSMPQLISNYEIREELPLGKESHLRVKVTSKKELKNVKIQIALPKEITGEENTKILTWKGNLNPGENYIILKVRSIKEGEYPVEVKIKKNSKEKKFIKNVKITRI